MNYLLVDDPKVSLGTAMASISMPVLHRDPFATKPTTTVLALSGPKRCTKQDSKPVIIKRVSRNSTP